MKPPEPLRVLVVDDDPDTRANLSDILGLDGHLVETAGSVADALNRRDWAGISAVLLDRRLPDGTSDGLLPHLRTLAPDAAVLIVTGFADLQGAIAALRQGAADYILKPVNPEALRASLTRVAERQQLARAKEQSEAAFRTLVEAAPCLILILRTDRSVAYFSPFAEELADQREEAVAGKDYVEALIPEEYREAAAASFSRVLAGQVVRGEEIPVRRPDGSFRAVLWNALSLSDYEGGPAVLAVGQDITGLKQAQERTLQSERLAAIGQMVTGLAHESGNALARSQACLEMLGLEVQDRPEALSLLARIQKAQDHLQTLYEEVRNYAAPLKLHLEPSRLDTAWRQAWANLVVRRQGRQTALREESTGVDLGCTVDVFRLEQVFRNILENSLAACADPVEVAIRASDAVLDGHPAVRLAIRDNGPGLKPEQRERLFEPFYTTKTKGTGLGMAIAKRIIEAHGGRIGIGSPTGSAEARGAEILILLPRNVPT